MKQVVRKRFKSGASTVCGTVFTIDWRNFKLHLESANKGRLGNIVSMRADAKGIHIFSENGDFSAWSPKF